MTGINGRSLRKTRRGCAMHRGDARRATIRRRMPGARRSRGARRAPAGAPRGIPAARSGACPAPRRAALAQVLLGDAEAVVALAQHLQARPALLRPAVTGRAARSGWPALPRPTRPRSWCSWARPRRSGFSMIMSVALGTSTPTSITVVATSRRYSPALKALMTASLSRALHAAVNEGHGDMPCRASRVRQRCSRPPAPAARRCPR
jgi:hypothetical protein